MAVQNIDPNAETPQTKTVPYGGLSGNAPKAADFSDDQSNVEGSPGANLNPAQPSLAQTNKEETTNNPQVNHLGPDVGAVAAPTYNSPSVHDLAVQTVEERGGPLAHENPNFDASVKEVEDQMNATLKRTQS